MALPAPHANDRVKVLIADDEELIADTLRKILNGSGFDATAVYNGQHAVDVVRVWHPDIFLSDVMMPGLNGIEAAILVSRMAPACRIVLFSGNSGTADLRLEAHAQGYDFQFIEKPMHPRDLLAHLRRWA